MITKLATPHAELASKASQRNTCGATVRPRGTRVRKVLHSDRRLRVLADKCPAGFSAEQASGRWAQELIS